MSGTKARQNLTTSALLLILNSTRASEIPNLLKGLEIDQQDHLMAYLYKVSARAGHVSTTVMTTQGMSALSQGSDVSGSVLLTWHEKVSAVPAPKTFLHQVICIPLTTCS